MPGMEPTEIMLTYIQACKGNSGMPTGNLQSNLELNVQRLCNFGLYLQKNQRIHFSLRSPTLFHRTVNRVHYPLN